jgi:hypothetical protein
MKRRDFLKIGVGAAVTMPLLADEVASQTATAVDGVDYGPWKDEDWSVKFESVTDRITKDTYDAFFSDARRADSPSNFLSYLLKGTNLPHCEVADMKTFTGYAKNILFVTFIGVVFTSNTRELSENSFAGYEHAVFSLSTPDSRTGMSLSFAEMSYA